MAKKKIDVYKEIVYKSDDSAQDTVKSKAKESKLQRKKENKRKRRIIVGAIMFALMTIGVVAIVAQGISLGKKLTDNTKEKDRYNELLATLVVADPLPFESPDQADQTLLLSSSIWAAVKNENMDKYEKNDFSQTYLPAVDVDKYFAKVFGTTYKLQHQSFSIDGIDFEFDQEKQAYIIPITSFPTGFTPKVAKIKTSFKEKIVTVGYISPAVSWTDTSDGSISKYVDYIFQKQDKNFCLVAVRESAMKVENTQNK